MKGWQPGNIWSLHGFLNPFQNRRIWTFFPILHFSNSRVYHDESWRLPNCHIQGLEKWIFLRCLIFKEFVFPEKSLGNVPSLWPNCENKFFEPDHHIFDLMSHSKISNSDHQFPGTLSQKKEYDFLGRINRILKKKYVLVFRHWGGLDLKIKGICE